MCIPLSKEKYSIPKSSMLFSSSSIILKFFPWIKNFHKTFNPLQEKITEEWTSFRPISYMNISRQNEILSMVIFCSYQVIPWLRSQTRSLSCSTSGQGVEGFVHFTWDDFQYVSVTIAWTPVPTLVARHKFKVIIERGIIH